MPVSRNLAEVIKDATYLAHRYDEMADAYRFLPVSRETHRQCTFITDEHLPDIENYSLFRRSEITGEDVEPGPVHFIFHSAYCCSTMLARAFDIEGVSMGLKEPVLLNDMIGWRRRGANPQRWNDVLEQSLNLLSRPFDGDRAVVIKPSNICTPLASPALTARPDAKALLLYAPIESFLKSIAKKEMWGRIWVRDVLLGTRQDGYLVEGFEPDDLLKLTDLQVAAMGWLSQHSAFTAILDQFGPDRVKTLDSETLLARSPETLGALSSFFDLGLDTNQLENILAGPAFTSHSKLDQNEDGKIFDAKARKAEQDAIASLHGTEIEMVSKWTEAVACNLGVSLKLASPLLS